MTAAARGDEPLERRSSLTRRAATAALGMALILAGLKSWAAWQSDSTAMLGSLADTGLDIVASLVSLAGVHIAAQPADATHRFGHGKAEALAAMFQVLVVSCSAIAIGWHAVHALSNPAPVDSAGPAIVVSLIAIALTLALVAYQRSVVARTGSVAITADRLHYSSDLLLNAAVIVALVLERQLGVIGADAAMGILIALWLLWGAWRAARLGLGQLMDHEWPDDRRGHFIAVAKSVDGGAGIHDLRTRSSGSHDFAQFHLCVPDAMTVADAHNVLDRVEARLQQEFPGVEMLVHIDPQSRCRHNVPPAG